MAWSGRTSPKMTGLGPEALLPEPASPRATYMPVFAVSREREGYRVPAVRVTPGPHVAETALFPLSREEIGEVWSSVEELKGWDISNVVGGWTRAHLAFRNTVNYPKELLTALLTIFQTQRYSNGQPLSWHTWAAACRRPVDYVQVPGECAQCETSRAFAPRVLWDAPARLPA